MGDPSNRAIVESRATALLGWGGERLGREGVEKAGIDRALEFSVGGVEKRGGGRARASFPFVFLEGLTKGEERGWWPRRAARGGQQEVGAQDQGAGEAPGGGGAGVCVSSGTGR